MNFDTHRVSEPALVLSSGIRSPEDHQSIAAMADQALRVSGSKRPSPAEEEHRLEERGLARSVRSPDEIEPGMERELRMLDTADIINSKLGEDHPANSVVRCSRLQNDPGASGARCTMNPGQTLIARTAIRGTTWTYSRRSGQGSLCAKLPGQAQPKKWRIRASSASRRIGSASFPARESGSCYWSR